MKDMKSFDWIESEFKVFYFHETGVEFVLQPLAFDEYQEALITISKRWIEDSSNVPLTLWLNIEGLNELTIDLMNSFSQNIILKDILNIYNSKL